MIHCGRFIAAISMRHPPTSSSFCLERVICRSLRLWSQSSVLRFKSNRPLLHQVGRRAALALIVEVLQVLGQSAHGLVGVDVRGLGHELPATQAHRHEVELVHVHEVDVLGAAAFLKTNFQVRQVFSTN